MWRSETGAFSGVEMRELEHLSAEELAPLLRSMDPLKLLWALAELRLHNDHNRLRALMADSVIAEKWPQFDRTDRTAFPSDHQYAELLRRLAS